MSALCNLHTCIASSDQLFQNYRPVEVYKLCMFVFVNSYNLCANIGSLECFCLKINVYQ